MTQRLVERAIAVVVLAAAVATASCSSASENPPLQVFGPWRDADGAAFRTVLDRFEAETGIEVQYIGTSSFGTRIVERVEEGDPPDVAFFPQTGVLADLTERGFVIPLPADIRDTAAANLSPAIAAIGGGEELQGILYKANIKSLVWYRPDVFAEREYVVPGTWQELTALTARIASDGLSPWCLGVAAGAASGWPATDWVEDIVLRFSGPDVYDEWVNGDVAFTDPAIATAVGEFGTVALANPRPIGGRRAVIDTPVSRAQAPMFEEPERCVMYRQASFQYQNLPEGAVVGADGDVDVFVLPGFDAGPEPPLLIGGDVAAALTDRDETWQLMRWLATPESGEEWARIGGFLSPHASFDEDLYRNDFDGRMAELLAASDVVRFDGSDSMYPPVGQGTFLTAMLHYIGTSQLDAALQEAQQGYER